MNVGLFGGTFDPIHRGHLAVASAAADAFALKQVLFVPADLPPHKTTEPLASFHHRYAMVALATAGEKRFVPSLLDARETVLAEGGPAERPSYSLETVRRLQKQLGHNHRIFFIIGMDAFKDIATWHRATELLGECEFIVVSRPGFHLADVAGSLPPALRPKDDVLRAFRKAPLQGALALGHTTIHLLDRLKESVSSTALRAAASGGKGLGKLVDPAVATYIKKTHLYRGAGREHPEAAPSAAKVLSFKRKKK